MLHLRCRSHGVERQGEDGEERVPLGADLRPGMRSDRCAEDLGVRREQRRVLVTECGKKARRSLDVAIPNGMVVTPDNSTLIVAESIFAAFRTTTRG